MRKKRKEGGGKKLRKVTFEIPKEKSHVFCPHFILIWLGNYQSTTYMFGKVSQVLETMDMEQGKEAGKEVGKEEGKRDRQTERDRDRVTVRNEWGNWK